MEGSSAHTHESHTAPVHGTNVQGGGSIHMWGLLTCGRVFTCRSYSCVEGTFTCGNYSHVEGPFMCGSYSHVEGAFMCGSYSHVEGVFTSGSVLTCGRAIYVWELLTCRRGFHVWKLVTCGMSYPSEILHSLIFLLVNSCDVSLICGDPSVMNTFTVVIIQLCS